MWAMGNTEGEGGEGTACIRKKTQEKKKTEDQRNLKILSTRKKGGKKGKKGEKKEKKKKKKGKKEKKRGKKNGKVGK